MTGSERKSAQRTKTTAGLRAAAVTMLAGGIACTCAGCLLPLLSAIPSVINLAHSAYTSNSNADKDADAQAKNQEAEAPTQEPSAPPANLTPENMCQMMALSHPNMVLVELRKNSAGAPEYRELRLLNSANEAHWSPVVDNETGADGWIPAVNFLKMDFKPALTDAIPDTGPCYLAYAPSPVDPNDPSGASLLKSRFGGEVGTFSWDGQPYLYTVGRTIPCLAPSSQQVSSASGTPNP